MAWENPHGRAENGSTVMCRYSPVSVIYFIELKIENLTQPFREGCVIILENGYDIIKECRAATDTDWSQQHKGTLDRMAWLSRVAQAPILHNTVKHLTTHIEQ